MGVELRKTRESERDEEKKIYGKLTCIHRPQMTLGQQSSLLSAGYGFSVCGEYLGTSESTVAQVQHASDAWPGRMADRGIFMLGGTSKGRGETSKC